MRGTFSPYPQLGNAVEVSDNTSSLLNAFYHL